MHRISYMMYNYKDRFTSNEFCIVGGSDILIDYITGGLPELDVYDVKHMRMDELLAHLLHKEWKKKYRLVEANPSWAWKSKMLFARELEQYMERLRNHILGNCAVQDEEIGMLLSAKNNERFIHENPQYSINKLLVLLDVDALVIHMQHIPVGVHLVAHLDGVAVDLDTALGNDLLGRAAGAQALLGHDLLNTFFCHNKTPCAPPGAQNARRSMR